MEIPTPPESGSSGAQEPAADDAVVLRVSNPLSGLPIGDSLVGLASTHPSKMGGEFSATLVAGIYRQMALDLQTERATSAMLGETVSELKDRLSSCEVSSAILSERLGAVDRGQTIRSACIFFGTVLLAVSIDLFKAQIQTLAAIALASGAVLLLLGWFHPRGSRK